MVVRSGCYVEFLGVGWGGHVNVLVRCGCCTQWMLGEGGMSTFLEVLSLYAVDAR